MIFIGKPWTFYRKLRCRSWSAALRAWLQHTGITRFTKDFDLFLYPADCERALRRHRTLRATGRNCRSRTGWERLSVAIILSI